MKKTLLKISLLIIIISLSSCASIKEYRVTTLHVDFAKYQKKDFFITTGDCPVKYESVGIVGIYCENGHVRKNTTQTEQPKKKKENDVYYENTSSTVFIKKNYDYKVCDYRELIDELYKYAISLGANGIIKIDINPTTKYVDKKLFNVGYSIEGLAIKI